MTYTGANTEIVYVRRRVIKNDLIDGVRRTSMPEYKIWSGMLARCYNENVRGYPRYGGRGITVCDRWKEDFRHFYEDMGRRPSGKHSIDRIDNDGNYQPGNCRWATSAEQALNKSQGCRDNEYFWSEEETGTLKQMFARHYSDREIASVIGRSPATIRLRAFKLGLRRDGSTTRLLNNHKDLAFVMREKGREAFIEAVAEKQKRSASIEASDAAKAVVEKSAKIAEVMASCFSRSEKMKSLRAAGMNLSEIGKLFGVTRERVRQIEKLGWPADASATHASGAKRKISKTNPAIRRQKVDRICKAWNRASREARLMFLNAAAQFLATDIDAEAVEEIYEKAAEATQ